MQEEAATGSALDRARRLHREGLALMDVGRLTEARDRLEQAVAALPGVSAPPIDETSERSRVGARILISLSFPVAYLGDVGEGLLVLDDADALLDGQDDPGVRALIACNRGLLLADAGRPAEGLAELDAAVRLLAHTGVEEQVRIRMNRADVHRLLGHVAEARRDLTAALRTAQDHGLTELVFQAQHNLGFVTYLAGDLPSALRLMPAVADAPTDYERGVVGSGRAEVLLAAGLVEEADRVLAEACTALSTTDLTQLLAEAELTRAEAAMMNGRFAVAESLSQQAADRFTANGNAALAALAGLVRLRAELKGGLDPAAGVTRATILADRLDRSGLRDEGRSATMLALEATLDAGHPTRPEQVGTRRGEPIHTRLHVRLVRARQAFARDEPARGRREARTGLRELAAYQAGFGSFDLQTASAAHGLDLAALAIAQDLHAQRPAQVLGWLERVRALTGHVPEVRPPDDPAAAALLTELRWVSSLLDDEDLDAAERDGLRRRREQVEREIRALSWTRHGVQDHLRIPSVPEITAELGEATMVVVFWLRTEAYGIVLTRSGCRLQHLGELTAAEQLARRVNADFDALALDHVSETLRHSARSSQTRGLRALDELLLAPLAIPDGPVVLLPPGRLAALPWGQLPTLSGRPVTVAPSASAWLTARRRLDHRETSVVAVAGPGLARAEEEVRGVAEVWPGCRVLTGSSATAPGVLDLVDGASLVHLATHGHHEPSSPLFSSVRLSDGPLVGYDLERLRRVPQQVVLSACDLGQATVRPGDEALGLARALLHSGTSTVVAGVAKVSDAAAARLMIDYHRRLAAGAAPAYALADALTAADEPQPFVCFGAGW